MYNEQMKEQYLKERSKMYQRQASFFYDKLEKYEIEYGKDISKFNLDEITTVLKQIKPANEPQAKTYCSFINGYRRWIMNNDDNIFSEVEKNYYKHLLNN